LPQANLSNFYVLSMPKPTNHQRLSDQSGHAWAKIRHRILRRDFGLCRPCKRVGRLTLAQQVDHIVPVSKGGGNQDANLQCICLACHQEKSRTDLGLKQVTACDASGIPLGPGHHWNK